MKTCRDCGDLLLAMPWIYRPGEYVLIGPLLLIRRRWRWLWCASCAGKASA